MDKIGEIILDPSDFINELGGLHDVRIENVHTFTDDERVVLNIDDIYKAFSELESYCGPKPVSIIFDSVSAFFIDLNIEEGIRIANVYINRSNDKFSIAFDLNIGGGTFSMGASSVSIAFKTMRICEMKNTGDYGDSAPGDWRGVGGESPLR